LPLSTWLRATSAGVHSNGLVRMGKLRQKLRPEFPSALLKSQLQTVEESGLTRWDTFKEPRRDLNGSVLFIEFLKKLDVAYQIDGLSSLVAIEVITDQTNALFVGTARANGRRRFGGRQQIVWNRAAGVLEVHRGSAAFELQLPTRPDVLKEWKP